MLLLGRRNIRKIIVLKDSKARGQPVESWCRRFVRAVGPRGVDGAYGLSLDCAGMGDICRGVVERGWSHGKDSWRPRSREHWLKGSRPVARHSSIEMLVVYRKRVVVAVVMVVLPTNVTAIGVGGLEVSKRSKREGIKTARMCLPCRRLTSGSHGGQFAACSSKTAEACRRPGETELCMRRSASLVVSGPSERETGGAKRLRHAVDDCSHPKD